MTWSRGSRDHKESRSRRPAMHFRTLFSCDLSVRLLSKFCFVLYIFSFTVCTSICSCTGPASALIVIVIVIIILIITIE